jgi:hypothetical protein
VDIHAGSGHCVNPFTHVVDFSDDFAMLQAVVAKMASPFADLEAFQYQAIGTVITRIVGREGPGHHGSPTSATCSPRAVSTRASPRMPACATWP